jgi:hypothetical protein
VSGVVSAMLTDVPELTDGLLDNIVAQSDAQAGGRSIRQLEELCDDCLVAVMQGLLTHRFGAGAVLDDYERTLFEAGHTRSWPTTTTSAGEQLHVATQVLGFDDKRLHMFHELYRSGDDALLATAEQMFLHVDAAEGRARPARPEILDRIAKLAAAHTALPTPERAGRAIGIPAGPR